MRPTNKQPIGIFDSGLGGLTIAKAIVEYAPHEQLIYFGDTAHFPYGDKTRTDIQNYAIQIVDFLLSKNCKLILIACNSASAATYDFLQDYIGDRAILLNVIDPLIDFINAKYANCTIGLIATEQTVNSQLYQQKITALNTNIRVRAFATPDLAPAIETYAPDSDAIKNLLQQYLSAPVLKNIDALILGCTHYPMIKKQIEDFYQGSVNIIDTTSLIAETVKTILNSHSLLNDNNNDQNEFYVSDNNPLFQEKTTLFFGREIKRITLA